MRSCSLVQTDTSAHTILLKDVCIAYSFINTRLLEALLRDISQIVSRRLFQYSKVILSSPGDVVWYGIRDICQRGQALRI